MDVLYALPQSLLKGSSRLYSAVKGSYDGLGLKNTLKTAQKEQLHQKEIVLSVVTLKQFRFSQGSILTSDF